MVSHDLIYIRWCLLRPRSFYRALPPHRQDRSGYPDRDVYPPAIGQSIKFIISSSVLDHDSSDDYPEIGISARGDSVGEGHHIFMVALNGHPSHNNSSRYPTIGRSETFDARTPNGGMIRNLNSDFNAIRLQTTMESIQRMTPESSPLIALAQQRAKVVNIIVAQ
jgi:hypothetical protein